MSFQDFGRSSRTKTTGPRPAQAPSSGNSASTGKTSLSQMSESILQYQRNVGILEKIVQSLLAKNGFNNQELEMQYKAQVDVIGQLEEKLKRQLQQKKSSAAASEKTTWIKLERDFERVKERAKSLQDSAARMRKQADKLKAVEANNEEIMHNQHLSYEHQQQLQLEQDRLNEEIMREREQEIKSINRGMHQVNEIYKDLAHIVASQQEQVDSIETHMEDSRVNAESGLKEVEKANEKFGSSQCTIS